MQWLCWEPELLGNGVVPGLPQGGMWGAGRAGGDHMRVSQGWGKNTLVCPAGWSH